MLLDSSGSHVPYFHCRNSTVSISRLIIAARTCVLLPLCLLTLALGVYRCWWPRSLTKTSNSDIFTYHWIFMEIFLVCGAIFTYFGDSADLQLMTTGGMLSIIVSYSGQSTFHLLTCVERYLAVVHPATYRSLNNSGGVKIRHACIALAWLMTFAWMGITSVSYPKVPTTPLLCALVFSLVVSFCSVSALHILIRPIPGLGKRRKPQGNRSKDRAFLTISAIMGALWFWCAGVLIFFTIDAAHFVNVEVICIVKALLPAFNLPSSLVLPVLYLHRAQWPEFLVLKKCFC